MALTPTFGNAFQDEVHQPFHWQGHNGCAILLIHGFPGTPAEMRPLATSLHQAGWTTVAPLLPGFGHDIETIQTRTHHDWLSAIESSYYTLRDTHQKVILLGISMGGALAVNLASKVRCDALVLLAPFWQINHVLWRALPIIKYIIPQFKPFRLFKPNFNDTNTRQGISNFLPQADLDDPAVQRAITELAVPITMFDQIRQIGHISYRVAQQVHCPTWVIQGKQDDLVPPPSTRRYIQQFPQSTHYIEVDGGHNLLDTQALSWQTIHDHLVNCLQIIKDNH